MKIKEGMLEKKETIAKRNIKTATSVAKKIEAITELNEVKCKDLTPIVDQLESLPMDSVLTQKLRDIGVNEALVAEKIKELMSWKTTKYDKNGNCYETVDGAIILKAIEIWSKITGNIGKESGGTTHQHLHLEKLSDDKLAELARKANKC
jgi:hypothetical protein